MVVTIVADVLGKENNGTTIACMNLIRHLIESGDEVRVLCADRDKKDLPGYFVCPKLYLGFVINYILKKNEVSLARASKKVITKALEGANVCHIMTPFNLGRAAMKTANKMGIPVTTGFHCQAENFTSHIFLKNSRFANRTFYHAVWKIFYNKADRIHYPTRFIRDFFEHVIKADTPGVVISNGVNDMYRKKESVRPKELEGKYIILFIGRLSDEKSHRVLVKAVAESRHKDDIQLIFAGCGPRKGQIMRCVRKMKITPPIIDFYSRQDLVDIINYSDLYCHPAEIEIEAISCLEAISCGLVPVISDSPRSATKYFALDRNNLFRCNDEKDLAKKIDFWIEHPELKKEYSERYIKYAGQHDQKACMEKMREMLKEVYEEGKN